MSEHPSAEQINKYISRTLPPSELLLMDDHLAACDRCMQEIAKAPNPVAAAIQSSLFASTVEDHLSYEQMSAFVDDKADAADCEIVEVHRNVCHECAVEIENLASIRSALSAEATTTSPPAPREHLTRIAWLTVNPFVRIALPAVALVLVAAFIWLAERRPPQNIAQIN